MSDDAARDELHPLHLGLYLIGGLSAGTGVLNMAYSFGYADGDMNQNISKIGASGLSQISMLPAADYAIPLLVVGVLCLSLANTTAWRETDGY